MRSGLISIAIIAVLSICVSSCGSGGSDSVPNRQVEDSMELPEGNALSEQQIENDPILQILADRDTYVTYLEPIETEAELNRTGDIGFDLFPYVYEEPINHTVCWTDQNPGAAHFMTISDSTGAQVLRVEANGGCVTELISPGIYEARVDHDNLSGTILPVFFVPQFSELASNKSSIMDMVFSKLETVFFPHSSHAQSETLDITTLITTNACIDCNLEGIIFRGQDLSGVNFEGSDISGATLEVADFSDANLSNSSLASSDLRITNLEGADLRGADLSFSEINECTSFLDADMTGAIWVDECTCSGFTCSNCGEIPMMPFSEEIIGEFECLRIEGPIVDDPGDEPIVIPVDNPGDAPILSED